MHTTPANNAPPSLWRRLGHAWAAFMGRKPRIPRNVLNAYAELVDTAPSPLEPQAKGSRPQGQRGMVPYNTQALPAAREQWQRGDWASLASLTLDELQDHPDRAKLALLAGIGKLNCGNKQDEAKDAIRMSAAWGCDIKIIKKMLVTNTLHTLERAASIAGNETQAQRLSIKALQTTPIKIS